MPNNRRDAPSAGVRVCVTLCVLIGACRFDTSAPAAFAADGGRSALPQAGAPASSAVTPASASPDAAAPVTSAAANSGSAGAPGRTATPTTLPPSSGQAGAAAPLTTRKDDDAGPARAADAGADPQQPIDDTACAFEFSACLWANPLDYAECARQNAAHCDLLGADGASTQTASGGAQPSAACSLQVADCVMRMPAQAQACMDMLATCTL